MRLESKGTVKLSSINYQDPPIIDLNLFSNPNDMPQAVEAFHLMRSLGNSNAMAPWRKQEEIPGARVDNQDQIENWIRQNSFPYSHASCTCKMGKSADSVVDTDLKVKKVNGLRIADLSVMPFITSGHTQGPAFMIGDKAAQIIKNGI